MKLGLLGLSIALGAAFAAGCSGADQNATNTGGGGSATNTGGGNTGGGNTGGGNTGGGDTGGGSTNSGGTGGIGGGSTNNGGAGGGTLGGPCGGISGSKCDPSQYCNYNEDNCGNNDISGQCEDKPDGCPDVYEPVCACDGKVYGNACEAAAAGVDLSMLAACPTPQGTFPCGSAFCDQASEYCEIQISDVGGEPDVHTCKELPPNCPPNGATCACVSDLPCGNMCDEASGGITLTCPGG
jgi:hypothetical protein